MRISDAIKKNSESIRKMGRKAIEESKKKGVPAYYVEKGEGKTITQENPDGTRVHIEGEEEGMQNGARMGR